MLKQANDNYQTAHFGKWDMRFDNVTPDEMGYDISDGITGNSTGGGKGSGGPSANNDPKLISDFSRFLFFSEIINITNYYLQLSLRRRR